MIPPGSGRGQLGPLAEALHAARATIDESDYRAAFDLLEARQRRRALVLVFTDLADPDTSALLIARAAQLRRRHLVLVAAPGDSVIAGGGGGASRAPPRRRWSARPPSGSSPSGRPPRCGSPPPACGSRAFPPGS